MDDAKPPASSSDELARLGKDVERLSAENLLLRQRTELEHLWNDHRDKQTAAFDQHRKDVAADITKRLAQAGIAGFLVVVLGYWTATKQVRQTVTARLDKEFASQNIKSLISDAATRAAKSQTKDLMDQTLKPAVGEALRQISEQRAEVTNFTKQFQEESRQSMGQVRGEMSDQRRQEKQSLEALRQEYKGAIDKLRPLVEFEEKLKDIELMKARSVEGDFSEFQKLVTYKTEDKDLANAVLVAIIETKSIYLTGKRTDAVSIWLFKPDHTQGATDAAIPAQELIYTFLLTPSPWERRAKAAELLGAKHEAGVPDALVTAMQNDPNLWVKRASLLSFQSLTGFRPVDAFDFDNAAQWWLKNKNEYQKGLPK